MFPGRSMGKAFRPSRVAADSQPAEQADTSLERDTRIRAYARRVRLRLPLFEGEQAGRTTKEIAAGG